VLGSEESFLDFNDNLINNGNEFAQKYLLEQLQIDLAPDQIIKPVTKVPLLVKALFEKIKTAADDEFRSDQFLHAKRLHVDIQPRNRVFNITSKTGGIIDLNVVKQMDIAFQLKRNRHWFPHRKEHDAFVAKVCHSPSMKCVERVQSQRVNDISTGTSWDLYTLTELLDELRAEGYSHLKTINLNLLFKKLPDEEDELEEELDELEEELDELEEELEDELEDQGEVPAYKLCVTDGPLLLLWDNEQTIYNHDLESDPPISDRQRRDADDAIFPVHYDESANDTSTNDTDDATPKYCRLRSLNVNFTDIGWGDVIISPKSYEAGYCEGICPEPLDKNLVLTTNHGFVKSCLRFYNEDMRYLPAAYCIPFTMEPMTVLYNYDDDVHVRHIHEAIITSCGCT